MLSLFSSKVIGFGVGPRNTYPNMNTLRIQWLAGLHWQAINNLIWIGDTRYHRRSRSELAFDPNKTAEHAKCMMLTEQYCEWAKIGIIR